MLSLHVPKFTWLLLKSHPRTEIFYVVLITLIYPRNLFLGSDTIYLMSSELQKTGGAAGPWATDTETWYGPGQNKKSWLGQVHCGPRSKMLRSRAGVDYSMLCFCSVRFTFRVAKKLGALQSGRQVLVHGELDFSLKHWKKKLVSVTTMIWLNSLLC